MLKLFEPILFKNAYVQKCSKELHKDCNSLSYLVDKPLSQNQCIKLGTAIESVFRDFIISQTKLKNIKAKNTKGECEKDHLFLDETNKIVYYAECKSNLNLDTEKSRMTVDKCLKNLAFIKKDYPDHTVKMYLLGARYIFKKDIPQVICKKYSKISDNVVGVNDYFKELGITSFFVDEKEYSQFLNKTVEEMYSERKQMLHKLSVKQLKEKLTEKKLSTNGIKRVLYERLLNSS